MNLDGADYVPDALWDAPPHEPPSAPPGAVLVSIPDPALGGARRLVAMRPDDADREARSRHVRIVSAPADDN